MVVFDAMGTVFDLSTLADCVGGQAELDAWFERVLHTAAALTLMGEYAPFKELARAALPAVAHRLGLELDPDETMAAFGELDAYPDAEDAFAAAGPCAILTNGGGDDTRRLLERAGLEAQVISVEEVERYKPDPAPYRQARELLGDYTLVAAHAWDVAGAQAAGFRAVWVSRGEGAWPLPGPPAELRARGLAEAVALAG